MLGECRYQPGQIVQHKLTKDKMLIVRNALADPVEIRYRVRTWDYVEAIGKMVDGILEVREEELEDYPGY